MQTDIILREVRKSLFKGRITARQRAGVIRIVAAWAKYGTGLDTALAYALATSYHETGRRMHPILEAYAKNRAQSARWLENAWKAGKLKWVKTPYWRKKNGQHWVGGGEVQLTHEYNYFGAIRDAVMRIFGADKDIHKDPDLVLVPEISTFILIEGITGGSTAKGDFTGQKLESFVNETKTDYENARKTVNPAEKGSYSKIAGYARKFESAIRVAREEAGERFKGHEPGLYDGRPHSVVRSVQSRLKELGYHDVGSVDGRWGRKTGAAVLAFRNENDLPLKAIIDDVLMAALLKADSRAVGTARTDTTVADLRESGSTDIKRADQQTVVGVLTGGGAIVTGLNKVIKEPELVAPAVDRAEEAVGLAQRVGALLGPAATFIQDNWVIAVAAFAGFMLWQAHKAKINRVRKHQTGEYLSR